MEFGWGISLLIFFISALISIFLTPLVSKFGLKFNILDFPGERKQHKKPIVRIGGIAILISYLISIFLIKYTFGLEIEAINNFNQTIFFLLSILFFSIGFLDDLLHLSPFKRLIIQILISSIAFTIGIDIGKIEIQLFDKIFSYDLPTILNYLLTIIWLAGITNAINWLDGLDGLAAGLNIIISIALSLISYENNHLELSIIAIALAGANLGFLMFNYYPSKILMGDCGSYFNGFTIACLSLMSTKVAISSDNPLLIKPQFLIAFIILSLPIIDMFKVILQRIINKKSPFFLIEIIYIIF